jgi:(1->4)-alpha-D-glucan 1-alpha-D-glucosylmutase
VGAWPMSVDRAIDYLEKAAREANQHTNWIDPNAEYEAALRHFVTHAMSDPGFADELQRFVTPLVGAGQLNSLAQTLLKLTTPGVPDLYQGTDLWDLSLVDPDNRRPVDFAQRRDVLGEIERRLEAVGKPALGNELLLNQADGRIKLFVIHQTLELRRQHETLFRDGDYVPLRATGNQAKHVCAFARTLDGTTVLTVVPRLILGLAAGRDCRPIGAEAWEDAILDIPHANAGRSFRNVFTDEVLDARAGGAAASLRLADLLATFPVALWVSLDPPVQSASQNLPPP